jgi:hypothetical protein
VTGLEKAEQCFFWYLHLCSIARENKLRFSIAVNFMEQNRNSRSSQKLKVQIISEEIVKINLREVNTIHIFV